MKALSWINFILGLALIAAGLALSTATRSVRGEEIVLGVVIACLAASATIKPSHIVSWLIAAAGLWTLTAPAIINYRGMTASRSTDVVIGIVVLALGFANALYLRAPIQTHA
jgi:hypothetical protein